MSCRRSGADGRTMYVRVVVSRDSDHEDVDVAALRHLCGSSWTRERSDFRSAAARFPAAVDIRAPMAPRRARTGARTPHRRQPAWANRRGRNRPASSRTPMVPKYRDPRRGTCRPLLQPARPTRESRATGRAAPESRRHWFAARRNRQRTTPASGKNRAIEVSGRLRRARGRRIDRRQ